MLIRSISGLRGRTASQLTPEVVRRYAQGLARRLPEGVIIVGRDGRLSGEVLEEALVGELCELGRDVIGCGIVPTPTIQFLVQESEAVGGVMVTASHNPAEWNGLKFIRGDGTFFREGDCQGLFETVDRYATTTPAKEEAQAPEEGPPPKHRGPASKKGLFFPDRNAVQKHIINVVSLPCIDASAIRRRRFKVVVDAVNGAGSLALPELLASLGCEVVSLNCEPGEGFPRIPEPLPENITQLAEAVVDRGADIGLALDPDGDRLALVAETGRPLGEEYTLVLAAEGYILQLQPRETFVTNLSTSQALDVLATRHHCRVERAPVGEVNVVEKMLEVGATLGGEGNGGVILKTAHLGRDALVAAALVLNRLAQSREPLSAIHAALPQFEIVKDRIELEGIDPEAILARAGTAFEGAQVDRQDGIKFSWEGSWLHLRKSNTEPVLRVIAEAPTRGEAQALVRDLKAIAS